MLHILYIKLSYFIFACFVFIYMQVLCNFAKHNLIVLRFSNDVLNLCNLT